jgi:hypothetical protein
MYGELGAVGGMVDLSPEHALDDEAEAFIASQGYSILRRTSTTLTGERRSSDQAVGGSVPNMTVVVMPQPEGGVQIKIRGNDFEGVRARQSEWMGWSESLPRKAEGEACAPTEEQVVQTPEVELPPPPTVESPTLPASTPDLSCYLRTNLGRRTAGVRVGYCSWSSSPVQLAVAWIVFPFSVGFLNGVLGG